MAQLIEEPTRVARTSATIIDVILTNIPGKISHAGVIHAGISDHSLIYMQFTNSIHLNAGQLLKKFVILNTFLKQNLYPT